MAIAIATATPALDHLVIMASTLAQGLAWCEATLGVTPGPGGEHPLMGTHNRLMRLATPDGHAALPGDHCYQSSSDSFNKCGG
jgi:hypothetical protein